jgi:hypothetical protein
MKDDAETFQSVCVSPVDCARKVYFWMSEFRATAHFVIIPATFAEALPLRQPLRSAPSAKSNSHYEMPF